MKLNVERFAGWDKLRVLQEAAKPGLRCLSKDDARRMAHQIPRLPELVRIVRGIDPSEA